MNVDLSGGEAKRNETLQLAILRPRIAVLDELDSGLDVDALGQVARRIERATREGDPPLGVIAITHYRRLLAELPAQRVHVLSEGRIVASGGPELAEELERTGYAAYREEAAGTDSAGSAVLPRRPGSRRDLPRRSLSGGPTDGGNGGLTTEDSEVYHRAGQRARDAFDELHPADDNLAQVVDRVGLCLNYDVVGAGHVLRTCDPGDLRHFRGD